MPQEHPPTIRDVARLAGVHHTTVSRALRNDPHISAETRLRVEAAAAELKYVENPLVSAHMACVRNNRPVSEQGIVAFLLPHSSRTYWSQGTHRLYEGAGQRAAVLGYRIEAFGFADPGVTIKGLERIFRTRAIYGILLSPLYNCDPKLDLTWSNYALVQMGGQSVQPELHRVTTYPFEVTRVCLQKLSELGYSRIGLHVEKKVDVNLKGEWSAALALSQQSLSPSRRVPPLLQESLDETQFAVWIGKYKPDAVLTLHIEAKRWIGNLGLKIPDDIGFAHLDWMPDFGNCAGLVQNVHAVAANAVDLVVEQLHHNERGIPKQAKTLLIKGTWIDGATVKQQGRLPL